MAAVTIVPAPGGLGPVGAGGAVTGRWTVICN